MLLMFGKYIYLLFIPTILIISLLYYRKKHYSKNNIRLKNKPFILLLLYIYPIYATSSIFINADKKLLSDFDEDPNFKSSMIRDRFPIVFGNIIYLLTAMNSTDKYVDNFDIEKINPSITGKKKPENKLVILVMGESSLDSRYSAYGYPIKTTPNIDRIFSEPDSCIIKNVHSSAPLTRNSISMSLSFYTPESNKNLFENKSIIEMAKYNGYETYWIGSQRLKGLHDSKYGFIAKKSNNIWLTQYDDGELSGLLKTALMTNSNENKFIIVHLWGNHQPYNNFDEDDQNELPQAEEYDWTIHHTDRVLSSLIETIEENNQPYTLIYTSDHGEIVNKGHGFEKGREQYFVPFLFKSNNYNCQFIENFRNDDGWISGLMNKYILSMLLGFKVDPKIIEQQKAHDRILDANEDVVLFSQVE